MSRFLPTLTLALIVVVASATFAIAQTVSVPAAQRQLTAILSKYNDRYEVAPNDIQKGRIAATFRQAFCEEIPRGAVSGWIGSVTRIDDNNPDKSINLELGIHTNDLHAGSLGIVLDLGNVANDVDGNVPTTFIRIPAGSKLYQVASNLANGDTVEFSGSFVPFTSTQACEHNLSLSTYIALFRFTTIRNLGYDVAF